MAKDSVVPFKKLSMTFDIDALQRDLSYVEGGEWVAHVNQAAYQGAWDVYPLRCDAQHLDGHPILQSFAIEQVEQWQNLPVLAHCPAFSSALDTLSAQGCEIYSARLMRLHAGAEIGEHRDHGVGAENGEARLHIPITTNPCVEFVIDGKKAPMQPGELWYMNADRPHSVANRGETDRIHLVIDGKLTDWVEQQLTT